MRPHRTRVLAAPVLGLIFLALPATAGAQSAADAAKDHLAGLYYQSEREDYAKLVHHARELTTAIIAKPHLVTHQLHMPDQGNPHQVGTVYVIVKDPVLRMEHDGPHFALKFEVAEHDSHHKRRLKERGLSLNMDPTGEEIWIQLDEETPEEFRGSRLVRLNPESVSEWRDGAVLPDEMVTLPPRGWPPAAALEEARAERVVDAFKMMVDVWEELLSTHEKLNEMEARSFLVEEAARQKLRKRQMEQSR